MFDHVRSGGVYRTHAALPPCLGCGVRVWVGARTRDLSAEMDHVDRAIVEWSVRLRDGVPMPTPVLALMARKEILEADLHGIAMSLVMLPVAPSSAMRDRLAISIWERVVGWFARCGLAEQRRRDC